MCLTETNAVNELISLFLITGNYMINVRQTTLKRPMTNCTIIKKRKWEWECSTVPTPPGTDNKGPSLAGPLTSYWRDPTRTFNQWMAGVIMHFIKFTAWPQLREKEPFEKETTLFLHDRQWALFKSVPIVWKTPFIMTKVCCNIWSISTRVWRRIEGLLPQQNSLLEVIWLW